MNVKVNQNLPAIEAEDGVALWYRDKWHQAATSLDEAKRKVSKLKELLTKEKKRNEGGPDVVVIEQNENPGLKEMDDKIGELT